MNTFKTLLVAVDQSDASDRAVLVARDIAQLAGASLRLLHVREHQVVAGKGGGVFDLEEPEQVEQLLKKELTALEGSGLEVHTELRRANVGHAAQQIVAAAESADAGMIVMGSRGRSELAALLLGSTAYKVLHLADRPVLIVH